LRYIYCHLSFNVFYSLKNKQSIKKEERTRLTERHSMRKNQAFIMAGDISFAITYILFFTYIFLYIERKDAEGNLYKTQYDCRGVTMGGEWGVTPPLSSELMDTTF
jgi:hypothetical protein